MSASALINKILETEGIKAAAFARNIGVHPTQIYDLQSGKTKSVSAEMADKIVAYYPKYNKYWLLTGDGDMTNDMPAQRSSHSIRYWVDVDATAGGVTMFDDMITKNYIDLNIPEFRDCTDAVNLYGDSMAPLYKSGQIIILKEWTESFIDFGNVYLIVTKSGNRMVKYLRKGTDKQHVLCVSENKEFDPFEIELGDILRLYLVKGSVQKNTL